MESFLVVYLGLLVLAPLFVALERRAPAVPLVRTPRARSTDAVYWLITPFFGGSLSRVLSLGLVGVVALALGHGLDGDGFVAGLQAALPFAQLPLVAQFALALLLTDALGYWSHRVRHTRGLWPFHAVHHATEDLSALAAARLHPLDEVLDSVLLTVPVVLLGFSFPVVFALGPFYLLHTLLLHANLGWSFGPLGRVFSSPRFHRRHHARQLPPANFGGVFAFFDVLFGTFSLPREEPAPFGVPKRDVPESVVGQLAHPFIQLWRAR